MRHVVFIASLFALGCGAAHVVAEREVDVRIRRGPPCHVEVRADGEIVSTVTGPAKCDVQVPP